MVLNQNKGKVFHQKFILQVYNTHFESGLNHSIGLKEVFNSTGGNICPTGTKAACPRRWPFFVTRQGVGCTLTSKSIFAMND